ncbi:MAG: dihydrofolate reductase [Phycisphaerae bacterium]|nr:dihydrofolate reductase [Phycisphaerae bacterium]
MNTLLVAMDEEHLIGRGDELPWKLPEDLRLFRKRTMGNTLIMGRKTWQSLPGDKPYLDGRINFVITYEPDRWREELGDKIHPTFGPHFADTIELAISTAHRQFPEFVSEFFIVGGRRIYELAMRRNLVDRMFITHVKGKHIGDVYFPDIGDEWVGRSEHQTDDFEIMEYVKKP